ncbi:mitochondrial 54S ribosomal protein mL49 [Aspergillus clavatus NRRL 1]|uniref:Large ribosomal subunit protein mL49 n=1 Tax=Aspergillus clavatus (strain ATCC 1007 / CBS 513.65 / DSM 816 / NCTC 3887 / NRRL 1 / QM 1276 / 107) TaxID=344612 RepID=A1CKN8_ASPCL|nr:mitochondrial large ribosomal subunit L49, putative [Aspergillus clavatus NRRL 1]EAW09712.1 mitochondrial large ribosomal subunit L49, putative [Aspergillus clavatus NRRL 1]
MASFLQSLPVCSAVRKQSTAAPLYLNASQFIASSRTCSSFSTLSSQSRLVQSHRKDGGREERKISESWRPVEKKHVLLIDDPPDRALKSAHSSNSRFPTQQRRTFLVQLKRQSQTLKETPTSTGAVPPPGAKLQLTNLPYFIRRTASNQLPVYLVTKAGGTKQQTKIQKTEGDLDALRSDLARYLGLESSDPRAPKSPDVTINRLNGHIVVKGWRKPEITKFLLERNF